METCRLCLTEDSRFTEVSEVHEGFPLSVIIMIVCPIKVETNDSLPRKICEECLEIVLSAYVLRDQSIKSDRTLRDSFQRLKTKITNESNRNENHLQDTNEMKPVKQEPMEPEYNVVAKKREKSTEKHSMPSRSSQATRIPTSKSVMTPQPNLKPVQKSAVPPHVNLHRAYSKSIAWSFFGKLCNEFDVVIDGKYNYCSLCVDQRLLKKFSASGATSCMIQHLARSHGIVGNMAKSTKTFQCDICPAKFSKREFIAVHMITDHSKAINYKVNCISDESPLWNYFGKLAYRNRVEVVEMSLYNFCKICVEKNQTLSGKFIDNGSQNVLLQHLRTQHNISLEPLAGTSIGTGHDNATTEEICNKIKFNEQGFGIHCHKASVNKSLVWKYFGNLVDSNHKQIEPKSKHHYCKPCFDNGIRAKYFITVSSTSGLNHLKQKHGIGGAQDSLPATSNKCKVCGEIFEIKKELSNHMNLHHPTQAQTSNINCRLCSKSFETNFDRKMHMRVHDRKSFHCPRCPSKYTTPNRLKNHLYAHKPNNWSRFICDDCGRVFSQKKSIRHHILNHHNGKQIEMKYECSQCDKKYFREEHYMAHFMKHTEEKPQVCNHCDMAFANENDLLRHLKDMHVGDKIYKCTIDGCKRMFGSRVELSEHYQVHYQNDDDCSIIEVKQE